MIGFIVLLVDALLQRRRRRGSVIGLRRIPDVIEYILRESSRGRAERARAIVHKAIVQKKSSSPW